MYSCSIWNLRAEAWRGLHIYTLNNARAYLDLYCNSLERFQFYICIIFAGGLNPKSVNKWITHQEWKDTSTSNCSGFCPRISYFDFVFFFLVAPYSGTVFMKWVLQAADRVWAHLSCLKYLSLPCPISHFISILMKNSVVLKSLHSLFHDILLHSKVLR